VTPLRWLRIWIATLLLGGLAGCAHEGRADAAAEDRAQPGAGASAATAAPAGALCEHKVPADQCTRCNPGLVAAFKAKGDWCEGHGVPESHCFACNPGLSFAAVAASKPAHKAGPPVVPSAVALCQHKVPAELCTRCNPDLADVFKAKGDWCREHGVPESQCLSCNPKMTFGGTPAAAGPPWCNEHGVPEAMCTKCKPQLVAKFIEANDFCREHGLPESVCPHCHPERVTAAGHQPPEFPPPGTKVKLATPETEREAGIQTERVATRPFADTVDVIGQLQFDGNRLARLSSRGEALITEVKVDVGDDVKRGQPLVVLSSSGIGLDQSRLLSTAARLEAARTALARAESLADGGIVPKREAEQARAEAAAARAEHEAAQSALRSAGPGGAGSGGRYVITSPFDGTVVSRDAVIGRNVTSETPLVEVADLTTMWAVLDVPERDAAAIRRGQAVTLAFPGLGGVGREGTIGRIGAAVDSLTRTVRARVDLPNTDRGLRAGLFVRARIEISEIHDALLVPRDAIQLAEGRALVFVRTAPGEFNPVPVRLGGHTNREIEVLDGLSPGAEVVTVGAFVLKTEILKDSIGAGCADD
jgi:cobalt-zinc-cadmium efflux system membrane fusion protein